MSEVTANLFKSLHRAVEAHDVELLLSLYHEDAQLRIVDRNHPPSEPLDIRGREAIAAHLRDVFTRDMVHRIEDEVLGEDRLAFTEFCEYPDGIRVITSAMLLLREDKIARALELQEWDEAVPLPAAPEAHHTAGDPGAPAL